MQSACQWYLASKLYNASLIYYYTFSLVSSLARYTSNIHVPTSLILILQKAVIC